MDIHKHIQCSLTTNLYGQVLRPKREFSFTVFAPSRSGSGANKREDFCPMNSQGRIGLLPAKSHETRRTRTQVPRM